MKKILLIVAFFALAAMTFYFSACLPSSSRGTNYGASPYGVGGSGGMMGGGGGMMGGTMGQGGMMGPGMMGGGPGGSGSEIGGQNIPISYLPNGERIYYTGISDSGRPIGKYGGPMWLNMRGGGCVSCHGEDGRGGVPVPMGSAIPPDISYYALTDAHQDPGNGHTHQPYSEELIKRAIVRGINAEGKSLNSTMPRWQMSDGDLQDLMDYLKSFPRPELTVSGERPQGYDGHTADSSTSKLVDDGHPPSASTVISHDSSTSIHSDGEQPHSAPAEASAGSPSYTLLVSLLAVVAATFGTVFYVKRRGEPASSASQSPPGLRELKR